MTARAPSIFYRRLQARVAALPGVQSATLTSNPPMAGFPCKSDVYVQGHPIPPGQSPPNVMCNSVDRSYFETLRIPLLLGRDFRLSDDESATAVAIINQTMARQFWPHEDPIGKQFSDSPSGPLIQVVGVAANAKYLTIVEDPQPCLYLPLTQDFSARRTLLVRTFAARNLSPARSNRKSAHSRRACRFSICRRCSRRSTAPSDSSRSASRRRWRRSWEEWDSFSR